MITIFGQTKQDKYSTGTYDGISLNVNLYHATTNTSIAATDFNPAYVGVKVTLKRNNMTKQLMGDNLQILGTSSTLKGGYHEFSKGIDTTYPAVGVKAVKTKAVFLPFGGPIRIAPGDELIVEISPANTGAISANIDASASNIDFSARPCIGYEEGIYETVVEVIQANATNHPQTLGDNITHIAVLNFDKTDLGSKVIKNVSLTSEFYDVSYTFEQLLAEQVRHNALGRQRYGTALPLGASSETVYRGLDYLPQSFVIFDGSKDAHLDGAKLQLLLEGTLVSGSQNYVVVKRFTLTKADLEDSLQRQQKHLKENVVKVIQNG